MFLNKAVCPLGSATLRCGGGGVGNITATGPPVPPAHLLVRPLHGLAKQVGQHSLPYDRPHVVVRPGQLWAYNLQNVFIASGRHRSKKAPHYHCKRGCVRVCRAYLYTTIKCAPEQRCMGLHIGLLEAYWYGSMHG